MGLYLCIQGINWTYGQHLMEEWNLTRWHARARLHFLGKVATYSGPNLLGGKEQLIEEMAQILERLGMLQPPESCGSEDLGSGQGSHIGRFEKGAVRPVDHAWPGWVARLRFRAFYSRTLGGRRGTWSAKCRRRMGGHSSGHPGQPATISRQEHAHGLGISRACPVPKSGENGKSTFRLTPSENSEAAF